MTDSLFEKFDATKEAFYHHLFTFLRFESISTDTAYREEMDKCSSWLADFLSDMRFQVESWETGGPKALFARYEVDPKIPTLLFYAHYDVQPVDPLSDWTTPPFEPTVRDEKLFARGASDDKGQCFYLLWALKTYLEDHGTYPVNIKLLFEGEEECGSINLPNVLEEKKSALKADHVLIVDSFLPAKGVPAITLGARGIICFEVTVTEAGHDLHSGMHGGLAYNPIRALVELLASMRDNTGSIAVPGFYDEVVEPPAKEREELHFELDEHAFMQSFGYEPSGMENGLEPMESNLLRPTLEINGISGGYQGEGPKTVIPFKAVGKFSCRLVPQQQPERIAALVKDFIEKRAPEKLKVEVEVMPGSGVGFRQNPSSFIAEKMSQVYSDIYGTECQKVLCGGSVPISPLLFEAAGGEGLLIGVALSEDRIHAPNENFDLQRYADGFVSIYHLLEILAEPS